MTVTKTKFSKVFETFVLHVGGPWLPLLLWVGHWGLWRVSPQSVRLQIVASSRHESCDDDNASL